MLILNIAIKFCSIVITWYNEKIYQKISIDLTQKLLCVIRQIVITIVFLFDDLHLIGPKQINLYDGVVDSCL